MQLVQFFLGVIAAVSHDIHECIENAAVVCMPDDRRQAIRAVQHAQQLVGYPNSGSVKFVN